SLPMYAAILFSLRILPPPRSTPFPYTTLFRSVVIDPPLGNDINQFELVATNLLTLAKYHAHIAVITFDTVHRHTDQTHRKAKVSRRHTPITEADFRQASPHRPAVAQFAQQIADRSENHPAAESNCQHRAPVKRVGQQRKQYSHDHCGQQRNTQPKTQAPQFGFFPIHHDAEAEEDRDQKHQRREHDVEKRWADGQLGSPHGVYQQWIKRAEQDTRCCHRKQHIEDQQQAYTREQPKALDATDFWNAQCVQQ